MRDHGFTQSPLREVSVARALFSNISEYPGELPFDRGEVLKVIAEKSGIEGVSDGWWLCVNEKGERGIAPANRLQVMQRFDKGFFQVASPLMDDFFLFNQSSPFDDPFFRDGLSSSLRDRIEPLPLRRLNSCDDALRNVGTIRNIPIRVEAGSKHHSTSTQNISEQLPDRRFGDLSHRRASASNGRVSPPVPPARLQHLTPGERRSNATVSSDEEERGSIRSDRSPQRTLIIPSAIPGRNIEIPLDVGGDRAAPQREERKRSRSPKPESQLDRLTQRLKNLAQPFRVPVYTENIAPPTRETRDYPIGLVAKEDRSPSPSSSGICADITDSSHSGEETKRTSDVSSLSDQNSSLSDQSDEARLLPPAPAARHPHQPYLSRLAKEKSPSTSVLQTVFDTIDRPELKKFGQQSHSNGGSREWILPTSVEEDMKKNETPAWNHVPTTISQINKGVGDILEEEIQSRKRVVCNKMADCLAMIDNGIAQINKATAARHWRAPHLLQSNLNSLRDAVITINESVDHLVDSTGRISVDRTNPKAAELSDLLSPLLESRAMIGSLRKSLDLAGWTVSVLSRDREQPRTMDTLEQFVNVVQGVPSSCRRLLQWVQLLVPSSTVIFLSPSSVQRETPPFAHPTSLAQSRNVDRPTQLLGVGPTEKEKRLSSSSGSTVTSGELSTTPSSILVTKTNTEKPRGRVTFADQGRDVSAGNNSTEYATIRRPNGVSPKTGAPDAGPVGGESRILEEDDLESVMSDRDSLYQDYAYLDDAVPGRSNMTPESAQNKTVINDEDRQLVRFYAPQLEQHTEALAVAIEEFLATVENNMPPREFVQKGKLIILAAHKLIYIGDTVSQCIRDRSISLGMRDCADRLCELLKECVRATKVAADEYPDIKSMQGMVDSIISVSKSAHQLKHLIKGCC